MNSVYDYVDYPTEVEWMRILDRKGDAFSQIRLTEKKGNQSFNPFHPNGLRDMELSFWLEEFNDKALELSNSYVLLMHFYNKGIPDEEWYVQTEQGGYDFFPHFEEKHHISHQWFCFYMDCYYSKFSSLLDTICHIINVQYGLGVEPAPGFRENVVSELKHKDKDLVKTLRSFIKDVIYKKVENFRNDLTHNYRPHRLRPGIKYEKKDGKMVVVGVSILGNYTTTTEFVQNIEESIDLLAKLLDDIRDKIEPAH